MSYVVLARKWRPKRFEEVVGQGHIARTLKNAIEQDRVAHAYLFTGSRGVGKTTTARILSKALNCHQGPTQEPCDNCPSCHEISSGQAIDVFEIDGASNRGINEIRELRDGARYAPNRDRFKIYIIDEVHMLTMEAFNALLKTLEEPPEHVKFIFATTEPQKIPITILSRCQRFDFKRITQHDIVDHLQLICDKESIDAHRGGLQLIARQAAGGMRDALSLLDQVISFAGTTISEEQVTQILGVANRKHLFALSEAVLTRDTDGALNALEDVHGYGYDLSQFVKELVHHFRDLTVTKAVQNPERVTDLTQTELEHVQRIIAEVPEDLLHRCFQVIVQGAQEMGKSSYPKLIFEMTLVRMCQLEPLIGLDLLVDKLQDLEELLEDGDEKKKIKSLSPRPKAPPSERLERTPPPAEHAPRAQAPEAPQTQAPAPKPAPAPSPEPVKPAAPVYPASFADVPSPFEPLDDAPAARQKHQEHKPTPEEPPAWTREEIPPAPAPAARALVDPPAPDPAASQPPAEVTVDFERMSPTEAWKVVVGDIRRETAPLAATLEHAYVEAFTQKTLHLTFESTYYHFVHDDTRRPQVHAHLKRLFGAHFEVVIDLRESPDEQSAPSAGGHTLAQQRDIANAKRRTDLVEATRTHAVVEQARQLFEPSNETISVELND